MQKTEVGVIQKANSLRDLMHQIVHFCPKSFKYKDLIGETNEEEVDLLDK